jgi:hypothetical protein
VAHLGAHAEPDAFQVDVDHLVPVGLRGFLDRLEGGADAGVVEADVDGAEFFDDMGVGGVDFSCLGDVDLASDDFCPGLAKGGLCFGKGDGVYVEDGDAGAFAGEGFRAGETDAAGATGDDY